MLESCNRPCAASRDFLKAEEAIMLGQNKHLQYIEGIWATDMAQRPTQPMKGKRRRREMAPFTKQ